VVQARHLAEHASGYQTGLEIGRKPDVGRIRANVAAASRAILLALFGNSGDDSEINKSRELSSSLNRKANRPGLHSW